MLKHLLILFLIGWTAFGADRVTVDLYLTNNPTAGNSVTINGDTRTYKTTATNAATQITIGASFAATTTNTWAQFASYPFSGALELTFVATNQLRLRAQTGGALVPSISGTWGYYTISTQTVTTMTGVRVPVSGEPSASVRTNVANGIIDAINDYGTSTFDTAAPALVNFANTTTSQTLSNKTITLGKLDNSTATNLTIKTAMVGYDAVYPNGWQFFSSGASRISIIAPDANGLPTLYAGALTDVATNEFGSYSPSGGNLLTRNAGDTRYGQLAAPNTWTGTNSFAQITNSVIVGSSLSANTYSGTIGSLGGGTVDGSTVTNGLFYGTIGLLSGGYLNGVGGTNVTWTNWTSKGSSDFVGDIALQRNAVTSLASGNNAGINFGTAVFIEIPSGPTAAFTINGIANGRNGKWYRIFNNSGYDMTIAHDSGVESTAANRIYTSSRTDITFPNQNTADLIYNANLSRWILSSTAPVSASGTLNYVAKFGSPASLINSQILDNGTRIGFGTASPVDAKTTTERGAPSSIISAWQYGAGFPRASIANGGIDGYSGTFSLWPSTATSYGDVPAVYLNSQGNSWLNGGGYVGINTTSPTQPLDVLGSVKLSAALVRGVRILLPVSAQNGLYAVEGRELNIYWRDVILSEAGSLSDSMLSQYGLVVTCSKGKPLADCWRYKPTAGDAGTTTFTLTVYTPDRQTQIAQSTCTLYTTALASPATPATRKLLVIGDSTTAAGVSLAELKHLFSTDTHLGITLVGSNTGTATNSVGGAESVAFEAVAGKSYDWFNSNTTDSWTALDGVTTHTGSPFLVATNIFDLARWATNNSVTLTTNDWIFFNCGINDNANFLIDSTEDTYHLYLIGIINYWRTNAQITFPGVRIGICLPIAPSDSQDAFGESYNNDLSQFRYKRNIQKWNSTLLTRFDGMSFGAVFLVPMHCTMDTKNSMQTITEKISDRSPYYRTRQSNGVHPDKYGYYQVADTWYAFLKAFQ